MSDLFRKTPLTMYPIFSSLGQPWTFTSMTPAND